MRYTRWAAVDSGPRLPSTGCHPIAAPSPVTKALHFRPLSQPSSRPADHSAENQPDSAAFGMPLPVERRSPWPGRHRIWMARPAPLSCRIMCLSGTPLLPLCSCQHPHWLSVVLSGVGCRPPTLRFLIRTVLFTNSPLRVPDGAARGLAIVVYESDRQSSGIKLSYRSVYEEVRAGSLTRGRLIAGRLSVAACCPADNAISGPIELRWPFIAPDCRRGAVAAGLRVTRSARVRSDTYSAADHTSDVWGPAPLGA